MSRDIVISFQNLKNFVDSQLKILRTPITPDERLIQYINDEGEESTDIDGLSDIENESDLEYNPSTKKKKTKKKKRTTINEEQLRKFLKQLHLALIKKYNSYYSHQPVYQIINQVLNNESRLNNTRKLNLIMLNDYMTIFNESENKTLPTLGGTTTNLFLNSKKTKKQQQQDNESDEINNIFINGALPNIKQEHILQLINELPHSNKLTSNNVSLITDYGSVVKQLQLNKLNLIKQKQRLSVYRGLKETLKRLTVDLQKNLIVNSNNDLLTEISSTRILIPLVLDKLDSGNDQDDMHKLIVLKKKMNDKLEQLV